jgi:serine/threonine protein kinase
METHQGLTLDRYLREKGPLGPDQAAKIAIQVAQQMGPASGSLLIHPGRILVTREGTVRLLPPPAEELALPVVVEFPAYAAPEEIRGGQPDIRSGLYSLGSTLFELISGHPPYQQKDPKDLLRAHLEDPVPDLRELSTAVKPAVAEVVRELLEKDPDLRIQSTGELVRRLKQALHHASPPVLPAPSAGVRPPSSRGQGDGSIPPRPPSQPRPAPVAPIPERRPAGSARPKTQSHLKTSTSLHRGSHGHPSRARQTAGPASPEESDGAQSWEERKKPTVPYFSISGAVLGAFFGLLWIRSARLESEEGIREEAQKKEQGVANVLADRKKKFLTNLEKSAKDAEQSFSKAMQVPEEKKREQLILCLSNNWESPSAKAIAEALLKTRAFFEEPRKPEEVAKVEAAYQKQKEEALKLYSEGRIGDAISKMMEDNQDYKEMHDAEITELVEKKWSPEIESRWKTTKEAADRLGRAEEGEKALEEFRKAMVYGDFDIRKKSQEEIDKLQRLLAIRAKSASVKLPKDLLKDEPGDDPKEADSGGGEGKKEKKTEKKSDAKKTEK